MLALGIEMHVFDSCIRDHHASKDPWTPVINEELVYAQESGNPHDPYAVVIKKGSFVVGHVPRKILAVFLLFLQLRWQGRCCWCSLKILEQCHFEIIIHVTKTICTHYYWWIKYWWFLLQIANRQSLLLANILSCTVIM